MHDLNQTWIQPWWKHATGVLEDKHLRNHIMWCGNMHGPGWSWQQKDGKGRNTPAVSLCQLIFVKHLYQTLRKNVKCQTMKWKLFVTIRYTLSSFKEHWKNLFHCMTTFLSAGDRKTKTQTKKTQTTRVQIRVVKQIGENNNTATENTKMIQGS